MNKSNQITFSDQESARKNMFSSLWSTQLNKVFTNVAAYYDVANQVASFGCWNILQASFINSIHLSPHHCVLDVCSGTQAVSVALLQKYPDLDSYAIDLNIDMLKQGRHKVKTKNLVVHSSVSDVHHIPFSDNTFDAVTLQWATRHLMVSEAFAEIIRVLKPGGMFYHCDMFYPSNAFVRYLYFSYLKLCLLFVGWFFNSNDDAKCCRNYFLETLKYFYTIEQMAIMLSDIGFEDITSKKLLGGTIGIHCAKKPLHTTL